jgi:hypothetical protein
LNGTNNSRSPTKSQKPWGDTLVTSTGEVLGPSAADFIQVLPDQPLGFDNLLRREAEILREFDDGIDPEFRLPFRVLHVNVRPTLLARKEVEPKSLGA